MAENFLNLGKETDIHIHEAKKRVPKKMNPKRPTPGHSIIELLKVKEKERILKVSGKKQLVTHKGTPIRLSANI